VPRAPCPTLSTQVPPGDGMSPQPEITGWLPAAAELRAYEGIRRGDEDAFRALAAPMQPTLHRLAGLYLNSDASEDELVLTTWEGALRLLNMFRWHTPLATWVTGLAAALGRTKKGRAAADVPPPPVTPPPGHEAPGPPDWSDLPWSARWEHAAAALAHALAALPMNQREVVHGHDVEQWPPRRVCDVFGMTEVAYERVLADAHIRVHAALAPLVGQTQASPHQAAQMMALTRWLARRRDACPALPLDPRTIEVFRQWRNAGRRGHQPLVQA
jgi:DNA-directed RNA polymerase specialized sigma24 family protein